MRLIDIYHAGIDYWSGNHYRLKEYVLRDGKKHPFALICPGGGYKKRILCIGDSITFGAGVIYSRWRNAFPVMLEKMLGHEFQVLNYGISGATLLDEGDMPYCGEDEFISEEAVNIIA